MDYAFHKKVIDDVVMKLKELDIDLYLILTSEGCDPMTKLIPGTDTVGSGAFLFTQTGEIYGISSSIDAQDIIESQLFTEVIKYNDYDKSVADLVKKLSPKKVALNFSETDPFCDGLTLGRYTRFKASLDAGISFDEISSDRFIPEVRAMNIKV